MLVMVGSGEFLPSMKAIDEVLLAQLRRPPRVVCLPTAAGAEDAERVNYWSKLGVDHFTSLGAEARALPIIDRASANNPRFARQIRDANFVYLSGGRPDHLYMALKESLAWAAINDVLATGGTLVGCSAGAMIQGEKFIGFPIWRTGFGLTPKSTIVPHFDEIPSGIVRVARRLLAHRLTLIGIDCHTALVRHNDGRYEVLGPGCVTIWDATGKARYAAGPLPPDAL